MANDQTFVIVGASLAGAKAAETLRAEGFDGPDRAGGRGVCSALRAPAPVQGLPPRRGKLRRRRRARRGLLRGTRNRVADVNQRHGDRSDAQRS